MVRFARPIILFYDEHVIDLYHRICGLYRMGGEDTEAIWRWKRRTRAVLFSATARKGLGK